MDQAHAQNHASRDDALMVEVARVSGLLGSYVIAALSEGRYQPSTDDEKALADQVASVADGLRARADNRAAANSGPSDSRPREGGHPRTSSALSGERPLPASTEIAVLRWPFLARLIGLPGPPWQIEETRNGAVMCSRTGEGGRYTENVCIIGVDHARLTRTPVHRGPRRSAAHVDVTGPFGAIVEALQEPVRWVDEP